MTARPHTILKTLKQESNNQLCLALGPDTGGLATDSAAADWMKFREIMFDLYSVLDYAYFLLHCHFANGGCPDHSHEALHCGFPLKVKGVPT